MRKAARSAALDYERSLRRHAPYRMGSSPGHCDEIVGRFCLTYDAGTTAALPPEPEAIKQSRERAVLALTRAFEIWPADTTVAPPLVRFLVEGREAEQASAIARRFGAASTDTVWSQQLLGFALQAAGDAAAAEAAFDQALRHDLPGARGRMQDVRFLIALSERARYRALAESDRAAYEAHLWRLSDPLLLTPGNESRAEHMARRVYARILARAPVVLGSFSWGEDLDELTQRFGVPRARTQDYRRGIDLQITEHYDPDQLTYVPPALLGEGGVTLFMPGSAWPFDTIRARSGFAPSTVRRMRVLEHQISRFPMGDSVVLRADLHFPLDTLVPLPARVEVGLFLLDSALVQLREVRDTITVEQDTARATLSLMLPSNAVAYSLEARELETRLAARARYLLPLPLLSRPILSDVVMLSAVAEAPPRSRSTPDFAPLGTLRIPRDQPVVLYIEARGLMRTSEEQVRYRVELEVLEQDRRGVVTKAVQRLGRALGIGGEDVAPRITWTEMAASAAVVPIALKVGRLDLDPGLKRFRVTVSDLESGLAAQVERVVRIEARR